MKHANARHIWLFVLTATLVLALPTAASSHKSNNADEELSLMQVRSGDTLYVVGYAHLDTQWRWAYPEVIRDFIPNTLHGNFRLIEKYPNYIFNFSGSRRYEMMQEYYPEGYEQLKKYVASGNWFPCGSSVDECDANVPSAESIIRQVLYGNHFFRREFGKASAEFMLPDCFGFPGSMPGILSHCGIRGFSTQKLSWGSAEGIPFNVGVWEGLDGSSILVSALNPGAYVGKVTEDLSNSEKWIKRIGENGAQSGVFKDYHYFGTGDTGGPPTEDSVQWIARSAESDGPVKVVSSTSEQMFLDLSPEEIARLPRFRGDMLLTEHSAGSITSQAYMKRWNRKNELLADAAEKASVAASWLGTLPYPQDKLNKAWGLTLGSQMHDILPGTSIPKAYEYSWNDEVIAMNQFADVLEGAAGAVAGALETRGPGQAIVVYNPLGIAREDLVEATIATGGATQFKVTGPGGADVPSQFLPSGSGQGKIVFLAQVPSVGLAVYHVEESSLASDRPSQLSASSTGIENQRYKLSLDAEGNVASIFDKQAGREMLSAPIRLAFTEDSPGYWPAWNIDWDDQQSTPRAMLGGPAKISVKEAGPVRVSLQIERSTEGSNFVQTVSLAAGEAGDRIVFSDVIDWRSHSCNLKAAFPLSVANPRATYNWEVGTVERNNNHEKKYEVPQHQWFDLTDSSGEYGVTVLSPFKYGSDKPSDNTLRLTLLRTPGHILNKDGTRSMDYADQTSQDWGRHEISYGLAGHRGPWNEAKTYWQAQMLEQPLIAFHGPQHGGALGSSFSLASVDNSAIRIMACKRAEDSAELVVRLVEQTGRPQAGVRLSLAGGVQSARELNGQEQEIGPASLDRGALVADFGPYAVRTFALTLSTPGFPFDFLSSQPLALPYDTSVATRDGEMATGGFDGAGRCLPAEQLPEALTDHGVKFVLAPGGAASRNAVACRGQQIALPGSDFNRVYILAAASPTGRDAVFNIDGREQRFDVQDWGGYLGQWDNRIWEGEIPETAFSWPFKLTGINAGYIKCAPVAWFCSHRHHADGRNDIYGYSYLYRYAIDIAAGSHTLTLPQDANIKVLAISVAKDNRVGFSPAQPLYDTLEGHAAIEIVHGQ